MRKKIAQLLEKPDSFINQEVTISGWIQSVRVQKSFFFITINDGSSFASMQIIGDEKNLHNYQELCDSLSTGCSISATGSVEKSPGKNQSIEIHATEIRLIGTCDAATYPLQKKRHSFEFLRTIAHLRPRTNTQRAVTRVRNALAFATHKFFQQRGFLYINTPIITASNCEGAGDLFHVTTFEDPPKNKDASIDYSKDFFKQAAYLTVSGQLNGEIYASSLGDIYTFGPTFRAENSHTSRHLAEFWMIEPEMAFCDLQGSMDVAEEYLKFLIENILKECPKEMNFFNSFIEKGITEKLEKLLEKPFARLSYTESIEILKKAKKPFEYPVSWGIDLQSEHERYLVEEKKVPVIVYDYPTEVKAFYMRLNDDNKTVAAMDILLPNVGEIIGGSQREDRFDILEKRMEKAGLDPKDYWWYLELRKYGSVPHAGFGLGFERMVQFVTGMENIRDVIPFPRYPGHIEF